MSKVKKAVDRYYVIGYPVKHSLSPEIHREFAQKTGQSMCFEALEILPEQLITTLNTLRLDPSVKGLSVTLPFKEHLYEYCDQLEPLACEAQAVSNVMINDQRAFVGLNLDGLGLVSDMKNNLRFELKGKSILILGAGGAARGILGAIIQERPRHIHIANRTFSKVVALLEKLKHQPENVAFSVSDLPGISGQFDIVINATSASVTQVELPLKAGYFNKAALGYDLMYAPKGTVFTRWCQAQQIKNSDGRGMLIELSKIAFYRWRHIRV